MSQSATPSVGERVHRVLLRLYPGPFRHLHGADILHAFQALERDAKHSGWWRRPLFWIREWTVLIGNLPRAHARNRHTSNRKTQRGITDMTAIWRQDVRYALRTMKRNPGFAFIVVLTLGLGIGINVSVFSVVNGVLLRPLSYPDPHRLQFIWDGLDWIGIPRAWVNPAEVHDLRDRLQTFEALAAIDPGRGELNGDGAPEVISIAHATDNLFDILGATPSLGRTLAEGDDDVGRAAVAVLSNELWNLRFGADPNVIGQTVRIDGGSATVVGVLEPGFQFRVHSSLGDPIAVDMWLPLQLDLGSAQRGAHSLALLGRVRSDVTLEQAHAELANVSAAYDEEFYNDAGFRFRAVGVHDDLVNEVRPALLILLGAVGLVLLIASTNIATLLLARAQGRDKEFAIRRALGAGGSRLVRQLMTEGLVMSLLGGVLGCAVATAATDFLVGLAPQGIPRAESIRVDPVVLAFAGGLAILVGLGCGIAPAVHLSGSRFGSALAEVGRSTTSGRRANRLRSVLVIAEFALSVVLLVGTGLLVQSFWRIQGVDPGFRIENVLTMGIPLPNTRYQDLENRRRFATELMDRVSNLPGVIASGITTSLPLTASASQAPAFKTEAGEIDPETAERSQVDLIAVTPGYFEAVGMTRLAGRDLEWTDRGDGRRVAVVDHRLVEHFWPEGDPIGRHFRISGVDVEVVGVVRQARQYRLHEDDRPQVYLPHAQNPYRGISIAVRSDGPPADLARSVRALVAEVDPTQAVGNVATLEQIVGSSLSQRRFTMVLMVGFGIAAMVLAAIGLYGVTGYSVSQRFQEIGLRMALGADRISVLKLVFGQMIQWVGVGLAVGIVGALSLSGLISRLLVDVSARDVKTLAGVVVVLAAVAAFATYLPAARAGRIDPTVAMRSE